MNLAARNMDMNKITMHEDNNTTCSNIGIKDLDLKILRIFSIIIIPLLLVPSLFVQLSFTHRYKSTFLHRQFLYTAIMTILLNIIVILYILYFIHTSDDEHW